MGGSTAKGLRDPRPCLLYLGALVKAALLTHTTARYPRKYSPVWICKGTLAEVLVWMPAGLVGFSSYTPITFTVSKLLCPLAVMLYP